MKFFIYTLTTLLCLFIILTIVLFSKTVLPKSQKQKIALALEKKSQNFNPYLGETKYCKGPADNQIWYEDIGPKDGEVVLLIMGHSFTALDWPNYFVEGLVSEGYRVVRFDNRGFGLSDRMPEWTVETAYSTIDMAADGVAILDDLDVESAHIVGASMGGMIAQDLALDFPERVKTLTLAISTGELFDKDVPYPTAYFITNAVRLMAQYRGRFDSVTGPYIAVGFYNVLNRDLIADELEYIALKTNFENTDRGGWSFDAAQQHTEAMRLRGGRWSELKDLDVNTLIFHGDKDPIFGVDHAKKLHDYIPHSDLRIMEDLGHCLPLDRSPEMVDMLVNHFQK